MANFMDIIVRSNTESRRCTCVSSCALFLTQRLYEVWRTKQAKNRFGLPVYLLEEIPSCYCNSGAVYCRVLYNSEFKPVCVFIIVREPKFNCTCSCHVALVKNIAHGPHTKVTKQ